MSSACLRALGLMSGTSVDGVDIALIDTDGERVVSFGAFLTVPYADDKARVGFHQEAERRAADIVLTFRGVESRSGPAVGAPTPLSK